MKNSAWYSKLWQKKLDKLPVKSNPGAAWTNMQQMLDAQLPVGGVAPAAPVAGKTLIAKIVTMAGYVLPAAAMVGAATWIAVKPPAKQKTTQKPDKKHEYRLKTNEANKEDVFNADSSATQASYNIDTLTSNTENVADNSHRLQNDSTAIPEGDNILAKDSKARNGETIEDKAKAAAGGATALTNTTQSSSTSGNKVHTKTHSAPERYKLARGNNNSFETADAGSVTRNSISSNKTNKYINNIKNRAGGRAYPRNRPAKQNSWVSNKGSKVRFATEELKYYRSTEMDVFEVKNPVGSFTLFGSEASGRKLTGNNSLLVADDKRPDMASTGNVNKPVDNKSATTKPIKNSIPKEITTPAYNFGLEGGLSLANGTGFYGGLTADYAITNRILIGAGLRLNTARKLTGSYSHPSYYRPDSSARFNINEERKISVIDLPLNLTYKVSNFISLKAGAVIGFTGAGSTTYTLGSVGGFRDTLRRRSSIDSTVNTSMLAKKVSLGFTGGVSFNIKQFSIDARYLALPTYKVNNNLGSYSRSYNPFQIGITYWFRQGAKKSPLVK